MTPYRLIILGWLRARPLRFAERPLLGLALLLTCMSLLSATAAFGQTQRAVLVGINTYEVDSGEQPVRWPNLKGTLHDVETMAQVLQTRYNFLSENVHRFLEESATRQGILSAIDGHLVTPSQPGDIAVFYFSGHGSQVRNTASQERDGMDEAIVPADGPRGARFIRDKELRDRFNRLLDRNVEVILIFDSCHSGSITRGFGGTRVRFVEASATQTVNDPSNPPAPQDRGALVLSAARDDQSAYEFRDEDGMARGIYTWALTNALMHSDANVSVQDLLEQTRVLVQTRNGDVQTPVAAGRPDRLQRTLFGDVVSPVIRVPLRKRSFRSGTAILAGGRALGLRPGTVLRQQAPPADTAGRPLLTVTALRGISEAEAMVSRGTLDGIQPGDLFDVIRWTPSGGGPLAFWMPPALSTSQSQAIVRALSGLRRDAAVTWVKNPVDTPPTHVVQWSGRSWVMMDPDGETRDLGRRLKPQSVRNHLRGVNTVRLFVNLPPSPDFRNALLRASSDLRIPFREVDVLEDAHYVLVGRMRPDGALEHTWTFAPATRGTAGIPMPAQAEWVSSLYSSAASRLASQAGQFDRVWGWMTLTSPPGDDEAFPYRFGGFENVETGEWRTAGDTLRDGEVYTPVLVATKAAVAAAENAYSRGTGSPLRYVYVFAINQEGKIGLLYDGSSPIGYVGGDTMPEVRLESRAGSGLFRVGAPFGLDTFFLLTSDTPISTAAFTGRRTRSAFDNPLERLITDFARGTRSSPPATPRTWSIQRLFVPTAAR